MPNAPRPPLRFARLSDLDFIHASLATAVTETIGDCPQFTAFEIARFSKTYLHALLEADPANVLVAVAADGERAGFILSGPEMGNVMLYWCYLLPRFRRGAFAARALASYVGLWDGGRFDKILAYTRDDNRVAQLLMRRAGFRTLCRLEKHFFGQDFVLHDFPLRRAIPEYTPFVAVGRRGRLWFRLRALVTGS